jgi:hypothetical protein
VSSMCGHNQLFVTLAASQHKHVTRLRLCLSPRLPHVTGITRAVRDSCFGARQMPVHLNAAEWHWM